MEITKSMTLQTYTVTITGYGSDGEGVARLSDGRVVFVRNAARGDVLEIKLTQEKARIAHGEILSILSPSEYRVNPDCPYYPKCGGCDFRHISYEEELWAKLQRVNDALARIAGLSVKADEILRTGSINGYRNKAVFHVDGRSPALYGKHSHNTVPVEHCLLLKDDINKSLADLPHLPSGTKIVIRSGLNGLDAPLEEELDGLVFGISGFFQVNSGAALLLYKRAREYASMSGGETLVDLYCGVGSLTLFVGRDAGGAVGVELERAAIKKARDNARRNNLRNIEFICADAASNWESKDEDRKGHDCDDWGDKKLQSNGRHFDDQDLSSLKRDGPLKPDCVIVDPPRKGLSSGVLRKVLELNPKRIVYVSCDPATLARDLKALEGYSVSKICAVDMFPRTANVECCCLLRRITR